MPARDAPGSVATPGLSAIPLPDRGRLATALGKASFLHAMSHSLHDIALRLHGLVVVVVEFGSFRANRHDQGVVSSGFSRVRILLRDWGQVLLDSKVDLRTSTALVWM